MTATLTFDAGTVVRAPRFVEGTDTGTRKGIVLGDFGDNGKLVWFYTVGGPEAETRLVFKRELEFAGDIYGMSERMLLKIVKGLRNSDTGRTVGYAAQRLGSQLRTLRLGR